MVTDIVCSVNKSTEKTPSKKSNLHYTSCITPKRVTSLLGPSPRHCAWATQFLSKKSRNRGELLANLCSIWPAQDLNLWPPAPNLRVSYRIGQYLNCRGDASPPSIVSVPPSRFRGPPSRFERWMIRRRRLNSSPNFSEKPLQFPGRPFFFGLHLILGKKNTSISFFFWSSPNLGKKKHFNFRRRPFFGVHSISATELRNLH